MAADLLRVLIHATLASSVAMLLVLLLRVSVRRRFGARAGYGLWMLVPLAAMVNLLPAPVTPVSIRMLPQAATEIVIAAIPLAPASAASAPGSSSWLATAWLLGAAVSFLMLSWQQRRFVRRLGRLTPAGHDTWRAQAIAGCPALLGAWRPRIILPADFEQRYGKTERELILVHEYTHAARGDAQINAFVATLRCLFWFNPLVHFSASPFRFDQELACDAVVLARHPAARRSYADAMLKAQLADFGLPVGCNWRSSHPLKERIALMKRRPPGRTRAAVGTAIVVALVLGGTYSAWAMQSGLSPSGHESRDLSDVQNRSLEVDRPATYRRLTRIEYPQALIDAKVEGVVYIKARVDVAGNVLTAVVDRVDPASASALADGALEGVRNWTFEPARKRGKPVASDEIVPVVFALDRQASPKISGATLGPVRVSLPKPLSSVMPLLQQPRANAALAGLAWSGAPAAARPVARTDAFAAARTPPHSSQGSNASMPIPAAAVPARRGDSALVGDRSGANHPAPNTQTATIPSSDEVLDRVYVPPRVTHHWRPPYPAVAYEGHEEGEAEVRVTIAADGSLKEAQLNRSSGSESLDQASLDAVKRYAFSAAKKGGQPIEAQANVALEWSISPPLEFTIASGMTSSRQPR